MTYVFLKKEKGYKYMTETHVYMISDEVFECFARQYVMSGYGRTDFFDAVVFSRLDDNTEEFLKNLRKEY